MPVAGLLNAVLDKSERGDEAADFVEREGSVEGFGKHALLMVVGAGSVGGDEVD